MWVRRLVTFVGECWSVDSRTRWYTGATPTLSSLLRLLIPAGDQDIGGIGSSALTIIALTIETTSEADRCSPPGPEPQPTPA